MTKRAPTSCKVAHFAVGCVARPSRRARASRDTRARIEAAAAAPGRQPGLIPHVMLAGRFSVVAVIVGAFYNPPYAMAFEESLRAAGRKAMRAQVANALNDAADALSAYRIPFVTLNPSVTTPFIRAVSADDRNAGARGLRPENGALAPADRARSDARRLGAPVALISGRSRAL